MTNSSTSSRRMGLAALLLASSIFFSRILGFARDAAIAALYGASADTDAYYAAFTLPDLMAYFLTGGTLSVTFIPLFTKFLTNHEEERGWALFSTVATTLGAILLLATIVAEIFAPQAIRALNPGFASDSEQFEMAVLMTRIVIPAQLFFFFGGLLNATNYSREVFWPAALAPVIYNLCIILGGLLLAQLFGIVGFSVGVVVGSLLGTFAVPLFAAKDHLKFKFHFSLRDPGFQEFVLLTLPLILGVSLVTVDDWFLKYFGSYESKGAISMLSNARKMMLVLFAVVAQAAGQAALPFLTRLYHENNYIELAKTLTRSLRNVLFLSTVGAAGLIVAAQPIIFVIFKRGAFTFEDALITSQLLVIFALALPAWSVQTIAVRGFYAQKNTLTPMIAGTIGVICAIPIYLTLGRSYSFYGLAFASSIAMIISTIFTLIAYRIKGGVIYYKELGLGWIRGIGVGAAAAAAAFITQLITLTFIFPASNIFESYTTLHWLTLGILMGIAFTVTIAILLLFFDIPELEIVQRKIASKLKRLFGRKFCS